MAKKKANLGFITKIIVLALCAVTAISFFLPAFGPKEEAGVKYSNCQICFLSEERAIEKAQEYAEDATSATLKGNTEEGEKLMNKALSYELIAGIKGEDFSGRVSAISGAWFHFAAMLISIVSMVLIILSLLGKELAKYSIIFTNLCFILMIVALCCGISFLGTEIGSTTLGESFAFKFGGVILGLISSFLAGVAIVVPCFTKKKSK
ncbi:MAG: hypothetical protein IKC11_02090 [Clostridia bacterium]|nr:hypothetical protein [Clostridia bacterium]